MAVRPVDLQAPLPQIDEVARVQRVPQAASEREASAAVVQGQPEVRQRQQDVAESPDVAPEEAESERRRRRNARGGARAQAAKAGSQPEAPTDAGPPLKGSQVDVRGM